MYKHEGEVRVRGKEVRSLEGYEEEDVKM